MSDAIGRAAAFEGTSGRMKIESLEGVGKRNVGSERMLFGTDHPFFPPLEESEKWMSVVENLEAIEGVDGWTDVEKDRVRGGNALRLFGLS